MFKVPAPPAAMPRKIRQPISAREWLEDMLRFAGRDADRAQELLAELDEKTDDVEFLILVCERSGLNYDEVDHIIDDLKQNDEIETFIDEHDCPDFGDRVDIEGQHLSFLARLKNGVAAMEKRDELYWEIRGLCVDAGLIRPGDRTTDILPLLRMFLPVE